MGKKIRVATLSMAIEFRKPGSSKDNINYIEEKIEEISAINPDIIVLPEVFPFAGIELSEREIKNSFLDEIKDFLRRLSKNYKTYIAGSFYERRKEGLFNTILIYNREGEILGRYDKVRPTEPEMEKGIIPGKKNQKILETEFGKIGFKICFDANWHRDWEKDAEEGAELIIFSSAYPGGKILNSIALLNNVFIVSSVWSLDSGIIDNTGRLIVKTDRFFWWVWSEINLERKVYHWDFQGDKLKEIFKKYGRKIKVETFDPEALFTIEPVDDDISINEIIKEFELVSYRDYIKRAESMQDKRR